MGDARRGSEMLIDQGHELVKTRLVRLVQTVDDARQDPMELLNNLSQC